MSLESIFKSVSGQENADLDLPAVVATAEEAAEAVVDKEIADANAEIAEHDKDIAQHETAIEALEEKVEELEEVIEGTESMLNGTTDFNAALFAHQYAQGAKIVAKFGAPVEVQGVESYADVSTANLNAYAGIESFKETAGKAVGAIKKFFVDLYNSFINLFVGLFNKLKGIKNKAATVKASLSKAEKLKEKVSLPKSASILDKDGEFGGIATLVNTCGKVYSELQGLGVAQEGDAANAVHAICDTFAGIGTKTVSGKNEATETLEVKVNGATVSIVAPVSDAGLGKVGVSVKAGEAPAETAPKSKEVLMRIVNSVGANADKLQNAKMDKSALTQQRDRAIGVMEKAAAEAGNQEGADKGEIKKGKKSATGAIKQAHAAGLKLGRAATSLGADILDAQLAFVKAHI